MKTGLIAVLLMGSLCCVSCTQKVPAVPDSGRVVVPPRGSSETTKPWNTTTRQEGEAILGPLSGMRR